MNQYKVTFKGAVGSVTLTAENLKEALGKAGSLEVSSISEVTEPKEQKDLASSLFDTSYSGVADPMLDLFGLLSGNTEGMEVPEWAKSVLKEDAYVSTPAGLGAVVEDSSTPEGSSLEDVVTLLVKEWGGALQATYSNTEGNWETRYAVDSNRPVKMTTKLLSSGIYKVKDFLEDKPTVNWCNYFTKLDTLVLDKKVTYVSVIYYYSEELFAVCCSGPDFEEKTYGNTFETALRNMKLSLK